VLAVIPAGAGKSDAEFRDQGIAESIGIPVALLALLLALGAAAAASTIAWPGGWAGTPRG